MVSATNSGFGFASRLPPPKSSRLASGPGPVRNIRTIKQTPKKTTGYGLFFSDEEDEGEADEAPAPAPAPRPSELEKQNQLRQSQFHNNKSSLKANFTINPENPTGLVNGTRDDAGIQTASSSRLPQPQNLRLSASAGPSGQRNSRIPARRHPYSKAGPTAAERRRRENVLDRDDLERQPIQPASPQYTMRGAASPEAAKQSLTPSTPVRESTLPPKTPETKSKTWGQWLKEFIPESVRKATPHKAPSPSTSVAEAASPVTEANINDAMEVEEEEEGAEKSYKYPGSFDEGPVQAENDVQSQSTMQQRFNKALLSTGAGRYMKTPTRSPMKRDLNSPFVGKSILKSKYSAEARAAAAARNANASEEDALLYPRSFVARSPRRTSPRAHPYSRSTTPPRSTMELIRKSDDIDEETKTLLLEEELRELQRREKDRRVQEQEDRYAKRLLEAKLGRSFSEDNEDEEIQESTQKTIADEHIEAAETMELIPVEELKRNGKNDEADQEKGESEAENPRDAARTPSPPPPSSSFLFGGVRANQRTLAAPATPPAVATLSPPSALAVPLAYATDTQGETGALSFSSDKSSDSDKENVSSGRTPPPAPVPAHAQLPPAPPMQSPSTVSPSPKKQGLFSTNLSDAASKARSQAEKFKPHAPSGLRASTTIQSDSPPRKPATSTSGLVTPPSQLEDEPLNIYASPSPQAEIAGRSIFATPAPAKNLFSNNLFANKPSLEPPSAQKQPLITAPLSTPFTKEASPERVEVKAHITLIPSSQFQSITFPPIEPIGLGTAEREAVERVWSVPTKDELGDILKALMAGLRPPLSALSK